MRRESDYMNKSDYMKRYYIKNKEKILKCRKEYLKKRAKLEKPFQPALKIIIKENDTNEIKMV